MSAPRRLRDPLDLPTIPRDHGGPVFRAPWEAQVFALAVQLSEAGHFTWREWADCLAQQIAARASCEGDDGSRYYDSWLAALEKIVAEKKLVDGDELARRKMEWDEAARATPHGQPIVLPRRS
jgi:nitrile hydratase accessory protein